MIIKEDYGTLTGGELAVESIIAPVQKTLTAERAYAVDAYFIYDDKMYKATSAITAGSAIVLSGSGANATPAGTVMEQMPIGAYVSGTQNAGSTSVANNVVTEVNSLTLGDGMWLLICYGSWDGLSTGVESYRQLSVDSRMQPPRNTAVRNISLRGSFVYQQYVRLVNTHGETVKLYASQNSGSSITCYSAMTAVRIGDFVR